MRGRGLSLRRTVAGGFVAGLLAVLFFHQTTLALLGAVDFTPWRPFPGDPTWPLGVPAWISASFWGGVWGIAFASVDRFWPAEAGYWGAAVVFGALAPTLVYWFVVAPLKGEPVAFAWEFVPVATGLVMNGAWGAGTGFFLALHDRIRAPKSSSRMFSGTDRRG